MARKKKDRGRPPARIVSAKDTAANPLPDTFPPRRLWLLLGVVVALAIAAILTLSRPWNWGAGEGKGPRVELPPPGRTSQESNGAAPGDFVGSESCATCHQPQFALWKNSTHGRAGGTPGQVAVLARFDGTPIRFKDAVVIPAARGNRYTFSVRQVGREERVFNVDGIVGGGHMVGGGTQGFVSRVPDGTYRFLPFDFI
ncbi:MAG: hypothetical protein ABIZ91_13360, partial [Gemmatimonadaceae bacterium]